MQIKLEQPYRDPKGRWLTQALFKELAERHNSNPKYKPVFSCYYDEPGYINFRTTFLEVGDRTGYRWAMQYLGDWNHWLALMDTDWFQVMVNTCIKELDVKLASEALESIRRISVDESHKAQLAASRYLLTLSKTAEKLKPEVNRVGRPTKSKTAAQVADENLRLERTTDEDLERLGLRLVEGGKS
jgi:hypothetical protein